MTQKTMRMWVQSALVLATGIVWATPATGANLQTALVAAVAAGGDNSLKLNSDGTVWARGYSGCGQLSEGKTASRSTPVQVSGLGGVAGVAAGESHSLAVQNDGTAWAWGRNDSYQLGDGTVTYRSTPAQMSGISGVVAVAAREYHPLAVKNIDYAGWTYVGKAGNAAEAMTKAEAWLCDK